MKRVIATDCHRSKFHGERVENLLEPAHQFFVLSLFVPFVVVIKRAPEMPFVKAACF